MEPAKVQLEVEALKLANVTQLHKAQKMNSVVSDNNMNSSRENEQLSALFAQTSRGRFYGNLDDTIPDISQTDNNCYSVSEQYNQITHRSLKSQGTNRTQKNQTI